MAPTPTGLNFVGDVDDEAIDAAVNDAFDDESDSSAKPEPTGAPDSDTSGPSRGTSTDDTPEPPEPDTAPAATAPPEPDVAAQPVPGTASAPAVSVDGKPFQFKASGREQSLPWALERGDGSVVIPKDSANEFRRVLASQRELETNYQQAKRQFDRDLQAERSKRTAKDAEAEAYIAWGAELAQLPPDELATRLLEFQGNIPRYQLDLERRKIDEQRKLLEQQQKGPTLSSEEQQEQLTQSVFGALDEEWQTVGQMPEFKDLPEPDRQKVFDRYRKRPELMVRAVTNPQEAQALGIQVGQIVFDATALREDLLERVEFRKQAPAPPKVSPAAQANAQRNADQQQVRKPNAIPPTVRSQAPIGQGRDKDGKFTKLMPGTREYKAYMHSNADEDDE